MNRFQQRSKSDLIRINKHVYLNASDPQYYEKILRYSDPHSFEAHYRLGEKYERERNLSKASFHYREAASSRSSPFYANAREGLRRLDAKQRQSSAPALVPETKKSAGLNKRLMLLAGLIAVNVALLAALANINTIRAVVSSVKQWGIGMDIVYETIDVPYVIYLSSEEPIDSVERTLYSKAIQMGKDQPRRNIQLYGVLSSDSALIGQIVPLTSEKLKERSYVKAEFHAAVDRSVKIVFKTVEASSAHNQVAANLVRTALQSYIQEKGAPPNDIQALLDDYPNNYLSFIPNEEQTRDNHVVHRFDGNGGWVYHPDAAGLAEMFYPNSSEERTAKQIAYEPTAILISKKDHALIVMNGKNQVANKSVGIGKQDRTPEGTFHILDRVLQPMGSRPDVYGIAGLAMGQYAIHGTEDAASIGSERSLGCVRLSNPDIADIYPFVPKGASVQIVSEFPPAATRLAAFDPQPLIPAQKPPSNETAPGKAFNWLG